MDKVLLKRYKLLPLLKDKSFIQYIASLIQDFQIRYETGIPLSVAIELISTAIKYEPEVMNLLILEGQDVRERALNIFSLAIIEQLSKIGYLDTTPTEETKLPEAYAKLNKNVFIIHGRDLKPVNEVVTILREIGLNPIILHEQATEARTVVEKLEKYANVGYAIVILSGDEVIDPTTRVGRAGQHVIFEFGYFLGLLGRERLLCLFQEGVELPSDLQGIVFIPFKKSVNEVKDKIIKELKEAGYEIKV